MNGRKREREEKCEKVFETYQHTRIKKCSFKEPLHKGIYHLNSWLRQLYLLRHLGVTRERRVRAMREAGIELILNKVVNVETKTLTAFCLVIM